MNRDEEIFSIRIVVADYYLTRPTVGLDPLYSDFHGHEINTIPIIRIFGSNKNGEKTCMHIHGILPYFYIPYESVNLGKVEQVSYQIAASIDKALNISFGQANSKTKHVFKVQLVKGIPLYGYHSKEHLFLKIFLYNPRHIKRVANLLQNGAILGKVFQPYEAHIPFILQFLIDFNLYGMGFLHVPKNFIKFRKDKIISTDFDNNDDNNIADTQLSNENETSNNLPKRMTLSKHEGDINAELILNRFQILNNTSDRKNPGIESLWKDEKRRRQNSNSIKLTDEELNLKIPESQERLNLKPAESEIFYKSVLKKKIKDKIDKNNLNNAPDEINQIKEETKKQKSSTFNLKGLLSNSVYPEECSLQDFDNLMDASKVHNHLLSLTISNKSRNNSYDDENDISIVDEEFVLTLSQSNKKQNQTLLPEDYELLKVLQELEENADDNIIELDSTLAPITPESPTAKLNNVSIKKKFENSGIIKNFECENVKDGNEKNLDDEYEKEENYDPPLNLRISGSEESDNDDDDDDIKYSNCTLTSENIDRLLLQIDENILEAKIPQLDGVNDVLQKTPTKNNSRNIKSSATIAASNSPKSSKSQKFSRYNQLEITTQRTLISEISDREQNMLKTIPISDDEIISISSDDSVKITKVVPNSRRRKLISPRKRQFLMRINKYDRKKSKKKLPFDELKDKFELNNDNTNINNTNSNNGINKSLLNSNLKFLSSNSNEKTNNNSKECQINDKIHKKNFYSKKLRIKLKRLKDLSITSLTKTKKQSEMEEIMYSTPRTHSPSDIAREYDRRNNFFPEAGPSHVNYYELIEVPNPKIDYIKEMENSLNNIENWIDKVNDTTPKTPQQHDKSMIDKRQKFDSKKTVDGDGDDGDIPIQSFCENSYFLDSPSIFSEISSSNVYGGNSSCVGDVVNCSYDLTVTKSNSNLTGSDNKSENELQLSQNKILIIPKKLPPTYDDVLTNLSKYNIPEVINTEPFYGCSRDVTTSTLISSSSTTNGIMKKEVGHKILQIRGNSLNDCEEFQSQIHDLNGITKQRKKFLLLKHNNDDIINKNLNVDLKKTDYSIREHFCNNSSVIISTRNLPSSRDDAELWSKRKNSKEHLRNCDYTVTTSINIQKDEMNNKNDNPTNDNEKNDRIEKDLSKLKFSNDLNASNYKIRRESRVNAFKSNSRKSRLLLKNKIDNVHEVKRKIPYVKLKKINKDALIQFEKHSDNKNICNEKNSLPEIAKHNHKFESSLQSLLGKSSMYDRSFGLTGPTLDNTFGFRYNLDNLQNVKSDIEPNFLTILSLEVFASTRDDLKPNPKFDPINCVFYSVINNDTSENLTEKMISGYIIVTESNENKNIMENEMSDYIDISNQNDKTDDRKKSFEKFENRKYKKVNKLYNDSEIVMNVESEKKLIDELVKLCYKWDPDILAGYEIEMNSWGYVMDRGRYLNMNLVSKFSRAPFQKVRNEKHTFDPDKTMTLDEDKEELINFDFEIKLNGRILLNIWRLMRSEISLTSYTFENVMYHILHRRLPLHSHKNLTKWFNSNKTKWIVIEYFLERVKGNLELLNQLDLIDRTSEMAKIIGIQFYEILSRGSQYRVESMLLRMAKPRNFVPLSPSVQQRAHMKAPEYLPLILEPESKFYADPVIVLDFQSLYPSMVIAYNYCFSTCLGRVEYLGGDTSPFEFGASQLRVSNSNFKYLVENDFINVSPCGVVFVKSHVREGVLPKMLEEILDTRLMVKQSMKLHKDNAALKKILHSRQLALKLMANVTYGYTAANFSGRMPCVEVGDSIVSKGRETLERAIKLVQNNKDWNVKVIYGDTDSLFILVPDRTKETAFKIGEKIAEAVTNDNPRPVKLKLEKVYQPCILQTKKRYVGYMYESADQKVPIYEAKGVETVRRDGCPAVAKILEKSLRILFETRDVSEVKKYACRQFTKILSGHVNVQDLIFAKEFRGLNGYKPGACVPALELTKKWLQTDPRSEPRKGERVPFLIINGPPNVPLIRLVRSPYEFLMNDGLKINALYYITKAIIPPLNRCLLLIGADANDWFIELPRKNAALLMLSTASDVIKNVNGNLKKSTISQYFSSKHCVIGCGKHTNYGICTDCKMNPSKCVVTLKYKIWKIDRDYHLTRKLCESCCGRYSDIECQSLDCPVLFVLNDKQKDYKQIEYYNKLLEMF